MSWIRETRKKVNLSQYKMARLLGVTNQQLSAWENDKIALSEPTKELIEGFFNQFQNRYLKDETIFKKRVRQHSYSLSKSKIKKSDGNRRKFFDLPQEQRNGYKVISLFAGIGGMSLGFNKAGYDVVGHVELEESARKIYAKNFPDSKCLGTDVTEVKENDVLNWKEQFGHVHILAGGPPCQGFSLAGKRDVFDPRNELFSDFARIAKVLQPDFILLENVRLLLSMKTPEGELVKDVLKKNFSDAGYDISYRTVNAADYGVPQSRERVVFLGVNKKYSNKILLDYPERTHGREQDLLGNLESYRTFRDATGDLESLESGEKSEVDEWHYAIQHPDHVIEMLKIVPEGMSAHDNDDPSMRPSSGYNTTYKRIRWDEPSSTISTNFSMISGSRNVHPTNTRSLTIREAMRCQTFPDDFQVYGNSGGIRKGIGNAVPPYLAKVFAVHLSKKLSELASDKNILPSN